MQRNAHVFHGDADKVTIFGQSSGGTSVLALLSEEQAVMDRLCSQEDVASSFLREAIAPNERDNDAASTHARSNSMNASRSSV